MNRRIITGCFLALLLGSCTSPPQKPNILFIMADDHTSQAFGLYGSIIDSIAPTPNIRQLAREGMQFNRVYCTNSICVPSRASILTGNYSHINQVYTLSDALDPGLDNVAKRLQAGGYQTAIVGKWHLKKEPTGFDYYNVLPGQGRYQNPILKEKGDSWEDHNKGGTSYEGYSADVITTESLKWLKNRASDKPFMMMCHFKAVHEPFDYAARFDSLFRDIEIPLPASFKEDQAHRSPATQDRGMFVKDLRDRYLGRAQRYPQPPLDTTGMDSNEVMYATYQKFLKNYLRGVAGIDENIGRLLQFLEENDLADNTLVIYTSDQGYFLGEHGYIDKRWMYEESARMPFIARFPRSIPANSQNDDLILNVDFAPTFLEIAGLEEMNNVQGRSFMANMQGRTPSDWRTSFYYRYWQHERRAAHYGIRTNRYKLIFFYAHPLDMRGTTAAATPGWEFYDLQTDPQELNNLYHQPDHRSLIDSLKNEILVHKKVLGDSDEKYPALMTIRSKYWDLY